MLRGVLVSLLLVLQVPLAAPALAQPAASAGGSSIAVLPLRSRGLQPGEQRRIQQKVVAGYRGGRVEVIAPEELLGRLGTRRAPIDEARRLTEDGVARYRKLDRAGAREHLDRAVSLYRASFGEFVDPNGFGNTLLWRAAEKLSAGDATASAADFLLAVTVAPDLVPSLDEFPPPVVDAWEAARVERGRRPLSELDPAELADVLGALNVTALATGRAERVDREDQGIALDLAVWTAASGSAPARATRVPLSAPLENDLDRVAAASSALASSLRPAAVAVTRPVEIPRPDPNRTRTTPPTRPPRQKDRRDRGGFWSSPWVWAGLGGLALAGAGAAGYASMQDEPAPREDYKVVVIPPES